MASFDQKLRTLYLMEILLERTDDEHMLNASELCTILDQEYGISTDRRTIYTEMEILDKFGLDIQQKKVERATGVDLPSYGGVVANSYLPSNWLSALGLYAWARVDESSDNNSLLNPAKKFTYQAPQNVDDTYVVFIIGETTRWDHMGIFGYERNTTPKLAQEKNLAAFRGYSCDTATKLSLRCMFVRQGGAEDNPQRTLKEQNIFAVLKQLGFSSDLYAMQSEMWFYSNTMADNIAYREQIGAEPRNRGKPVDDMLLVDEMQQSLGRNPDGKHLIILHTKGSHFNYTQRYPRSFAQWKPECIGVDSGCTKAQMINSYDNSVTYVDHFISSVIDQVRDKKAIVFYAADHGESINEREHLHGTPRELAPPEQFRVPMMVWMSDKYLENPANAQAFAQLKKTTAHLCAYAKSSRRAVRYHHGLSWLYFTGWWN